MKRERNLGNARKLSDSQNFITETRLLRRIVRISNIGKEDTVWEIGTGKGHLTQALSDKCGILYSIEIDERLYQKAKERLADRKNIHLIQGDFLRISLPKKENYKVFANIPFFLTTQIIEKLTKASNPPTDMWLVMEKGAAKRFLGLPRETKKSLLLKVGWEAKIVYYFNKYDFHPSPAVDPVLVYFSKKAAADLTKSELDAFEKFIDHSLCYGIYGKNGLLTKKEISACMRLAKLPPIPERGEILYVQWLCLFRYYNKELFKNNLKNSRKFTNGRRIPK